MKETLTNQERQMLLELARSAIQNTISGKPLEALDLDSLPPRLREPGASFVTLTKGGKLRGCIGTLKAFQALAEDVREHASAAASQDYRFHPVYEEELPFIQIEISRLSQPEDVNYDHPQELPQRIRPHIDGVTLIDGFRRSTFLPQVWEKLPNPESFLDHLCLKMGLPAETWRKRHLKVQTYQVEEFHE
jgi:uncharacterized protein